MPACLLLLATTTLGACAQSASPGAADPGAMPSDAPTTTAGCALLQPPADPAARALVLPVDATLVEIHADRSRRVAYTFGTGAATPDGGESPEPVLVRDGFVAAHALYAMDPWPNSRHEVVLLDPAGTVVWHAVYTNSTDPTLHLGARGVLAIDTNEGTLERTGSWVIGVDGVARNIRGFSPLAAPSATGEVPARRGPLYHTTPAAFGWLDPVTGTFRPLAHAYEAQDALEGVAPRWVGDRLVYRTRDGGALALVSEAPDGSAQVISLASATGEDALAVVDAAETTWVLLARGADGARFRANVQTGAVEPVEAGAPFDAPSTDPSGDARSAGVALVLDDGALIASHASSSASALFRTDDLGATWVPLGADMPAMPGPRTARAITTVEARGGTTLIATTDFPFDRFYSLPGPVQVVRPADGVDAQIVPTVTSPPGPIEVVPPRLSADGLCVAYWDVAGSTATLRVLDVRSGQRVDVLSTAHGVAPPTWVQ
jgi:hypothetical protein